MRPWAPAPLTGLLLLTSACVGAPDAAEPVPTSTHALLRIERSAHVRDEAAATGNAFAGVVRLPESVDPGPLLRLSGKGLAVPALGQCAAPNRERDALPSGSIARPEFLAAGAMHLLTTQTQTPLAPHVFPSAETESAGVVYQTRTASEPMPEGALYLLKSSGSGQLPALELSVKAPELLRGVTVGGTELASVESVSAATDVEIAWQAGDAGDVVYVEVAAASGTVGVCAFRDSDGRGALPRGLFGASGDGSLALHRLREVAAEVPGIDGADVRFDFKLATDVTFR